jgi:hypothetical protein
MSTTVPMHIPRRRWHRTRIWIVGAVLAILASTAAVVAIASDDGETAREPAVIHTPVMSSPRTDSLIIRFGHPAPDRHDYPRVSSALEPTASPLDDPLVTRYGQP